MKIKIISLLIFVALLIYGCAGKVYIDYDALYTKRFEAVMANGGFLRNYEPLEEVKGIDTFKTLKKASGDDLVIDKKVVELASNYAESNNSDALIIWKDGKLQAERYFGNVKSSTPLMSKSLSKPLGAIAIGRAIQLNKIKSLDQSAADFITEWKNTDKAKMKIRHLLDMRSGFLQQGYSRDPSHPWNRAYLSYEHEDVLINEYPLVVLPGSKYLYSNATAELVAILIERATGQRYADFLSEEILIPLGAQGGSIWVNRPSGLAHSGCCMYLPADSWLRLGILLLNKGNYKGVDLLPAKYVDEMTTATKENAHYGLGIWTGEPYTERRGFTGVGGPGPQVLHSEPYLDKELFLFDGNANQVVYVLPTYNMVVLRMGKNPPKKPEWDNSYLPNNLVRGIKNFSKQ